MPLTRSWLAQGLAWAGITALIAMGLLIVWLLGFPGLLLLGLGVTLICVRAELSEEAPSWSRAAFAARQSDERLPEARAAAAAARARRGASFRYYRRCGAALIVAGLAGTLWQAWG